LQGTLVCRPDDQRKEHPYATARLVLPTDRVLPGNSRWRGALTGHRIGIEHIVERFQEGWSAEQIAMDYPGVALKKIYAVIAYYLHNQAVIDAYLAELNAEGEAAYQAWTAATQTTHHAMS